MSTHLLRRDPSRTRGESPGISAARHLGTLSHMHLLQDVNTENDIDSPGPKLEFR